VTVLRAFGSPVAERNERKPASTVAPPMVCSPSSITSVSGVWPPSGLKAANETP
jgi:hypothetical protein